MEVCNRRRSAGRTVVAGSVWESRMKMDEVKGGIKVFFNGEENLEEVNNLGNDESLKQNQSGGLVREKRKTWKCEPLIDPSLIRQTKFDESCSEEFVDSVDRFEKNPIQIRNARSDEHFNRSVDVIDKSPIQKKKSSSCRSSRSHKIPDETCKEFSGGDLMDEVVVVKKEIELSKQNFDVKEVKLSEQKPKKVLILKEKINQIPKSPIPISPNLIKQKTLLANQSLIHPIPTKSSPVKGPEKIERYSETHNKFQTLVDLVMWRDILKSSLVFGIGTLILLLPFVTKDLNFSLITAISYMALLCIAAIFIYKAILCRDAISLDDSNQIQTMGEEEAICLLKLVLPWLNKFILEIRHLLAGDPATTMKFAVSLFMFARCGSFITLWRVAILGFIGVFTIPKVHSSYSRQLTEEGTLWLNRCNNAWNSYLYLKAIAIVIFILVWNSSSVPARVWEVFMLVVAVRYYQEKVTTRKECEAEKGKGSSMKEEMKRETGWWGFFS